MLYLIEPYHLYEMMKKNESIIVDVREVEEFNESNIEGAVLIPLGSVTINEIERLAASGKKIVIHCRSGIRSMKACQFLMENNSEIDLYHLEGGILAWNDFQKFVK